MVYCQYFLVRLRVSLNTLMVLIKPMWQNVNWDFTDTEDSSGQPVLPDNDMVLRDGVLLNESSQSSRTSDDG